MAQEDREGVDYAPELAVGRYLIYNETESPVNKARDGPTAGPVHGDGRTAVSDIVGRVSVRVALR